jgi:hypothetical protein
VGLGWTDANDNDPGIAVLEGLAYLADALAYYQDQVAEEQRLRTRWLVVSTIAALAVLFFWRRRRPDDDG